MNQFVFTEEAKESLKSLVEYKQNIIKNTLRRLKRHSRPGRAILHLIGINFSTHYVIIGGIMVFFLKQSNIYFIVKVIDKYALALYNREC